MLGDSQVAIFNSSGEHMPITVFKQRLSVTISGRMKLDGGAILQVSPFQIAQYNYAQRCLYVMTKLRFSPVRS